MVRYDNGVQRSVYYVSKCLVGAEQNYLSIEKLVLALITASRRLRHYFDVHPIVVLTSTPIKAALRRSDFSGRMEKWSMELDRFSIDYEPRTAINGQLLADFIAEFTYNTTSTTEVISAETIALAGTPPTPTRGKETVQS